MKPKILLFALPVIFAACAGSPRTSSIRILPSVPGTVLPSSGVASVRYAENVKAYPLGRYVDPTNRRVMHEAHTIYRVEADSQWNLHAGPPTLASAGPAGKMRDAAKTDQLKTDELMVELARQKQATQAVIAGGKVLSDKLTEIGGALGQTRQIAEQNARLAAEIAAAKHRLERVEARLPQVPAAVPQPVPKAEPGSDW